MKFNFCLILLLVVACGGKPSTMNYGKTTRSDLISEKGPPLSESKVPVENTEVLTYEDDEKYQVTKDIVTHGFKNPKGDQKTLLFWKHKLRHCDTFYKALPAEKGHTFSEYELSCPSEGISVIYTEGSEFVSRVVEYEKK